VAGSQICVIAYKDNSTATVFSSVHTVQADGYLNPGILEVEEGATYTFVAYGYNDGTTPLPFIDNHRIIAIMVPVFEFLCGIVTDIVVNDTHADVHIPMKRMYSMVRVEASTNLGTGDSQGFEDIGDINISPYYSTPAFTFPGGTISQDYSEPPYSLGNWNPAPPYNPAEPIVTSESKAIVSPGYYGGQIRVEFESLKIGGKQFPDNDQEVKPAAHFFIEPNKNYTLQVKFSSIEFAVSNIYWDDVEEELTFERAVSDGGIMGAPENKQDYQGVYFKFGSLVGISPRDGSFSAGSYLGSDGTPIYVPDDINARTWIKTNTATAYGAGATWNDILPAAANNNIVRDPNNRFAMESTQNQPDKWADWTGDICQYIDNRYRLPTAYELWGAFEGDITDISHYYRYETTSSGWAASGDWSATGVVNDSGTGSWPERGATLRGAYFPGAEYLIYTGSGALRTNYWEGAYWSGSIHVDHNHQYGAYVKISNIFVTLGDFFYETNGYGLSVRCVRK
jgi:hypothetical protein